MISDIDFLILNNYYDSLWSEKKPIKDEKTLQAYKLFLENEIKDEEILEIDTLYFHLKDLSHLKKTKKIVFKTNFLEKIEKFPENLVQLEFNCFYNYPLPNLPKLENLIVTNYEFDIPSNIKTVKNLNSIYYQKYNSYN